jgi:hypothetical protein
MAEKSINFHKKYEVLHDLKGEFLNEIKLIYIFYLYFENRSNVLIVTNEDKVFAFGYNHDRDS